MIAYQVMAHPQRMDFVPPLEKTLKAGVTWDEKGDRWDTGRRAWEALVDSGAEYGCVIQDDAILCKGFTRVLPEALKHVPSGSPVVLYAGTRIRAQVRNIPETAWLVLRKIVWGPGIVMPTSIIERALKAGDRYRISNYDLRLSRWFEHSGTPVYYTWPSLVDHRNSPSLVPGRTGGRRAYRFAEHPTQIDWSLPPVMLATFKVSR